ncbi:MAG: hypothetical protein NZ108_08050, partial [Bacteroidia bacterium]|nr:hypothetical protein [Bacteroidia bacterium]
MLIKKNLGMPIIAIPIYDSVFKFMMEDNEVAKRFLSITLNQNIETISTLQQEQFLKSEGFI